MDLKVNPPITHLQGTITPPGSKSYSHRAFVLAGLGKGTSILKNALSSGDVSITIDVLGRLGVEIEHKNENEFKVLGLGELFEEAQNILDLGNSGTTIRILCALSLLMNQGLRFEGEFFRRKRPIEPLLKALKCLGANYELSENQLYIERENYICDNINIRGDISSQFITALVIVCSLIDCKERNELKIKLTTPLVSYPYLKITLNILNDFGITVKEGHTDSGLLEYTVETGQTIEPRKYEIPSDFSSAAFIIVASVLAPNDSKVILNNLDFQNPQGDKRIIEILKRMGANIKKDIEKKRVICYGNLSKNTLKGLDIDCKNIPDLFPILSVVGAFARGKTVLYNAENLRLKESDRISVMARELTRMGVKVEEERDKLIIYQCKNLNGQEINHQGDHRIAMACTIAALYANSKSIVRNIDIIEDSYPQFIADLQKIGVKNLQLKRN